MRQIRISKYSGKFFLFSKSKQTLRKKIKTNRRRCKKMVKSCVACGCTNRFKKNSGISIFEFPLKQPELLQKWLVAMKRKNFKPTKHSYLCSDHFLTTDYNNNSKRCHLKPGVFLTVFKFSENFLSTPSTPREKHRKRKADEPNETTPVISPKKAKLRRQVRL